MKKYKYKSDFDLIVEAYEDMQTWNDDNPSNPDTIINNVLDSWLDSINNDYVDAYIDSDAYKDAEQNYSVHENRDSEDRMIYGDYEFEYDGPGASNIDISKYQEGLKQEIKEFYNESFNTNIDFTDKLLNTIVTNQKIVDAIRGLYDEVITSYFDNSDFLDHLREKYEDDKNDYYED